MFAVLFAWAESGTNGEARLTKAKECLKKCELLGTVLVNTVGESKYIPMSLGGGMF